MSDITVQNAQKVDAEIAKLIAETAKINLETIKIQQETVKLNRETFFYPLIAAGTFGAALTGIITLIIKFL